MNDRRCQLPSSVALMLEFGDHKSSFLTTAVRAGSFQTSLKSGGTRRVPESDKALLIASSTVSSPMNCIATRALSGNSRRSFRLRAGSSTVCRPTRCAASTRGVDAQLALFQCGLVRDADLDQRDAEGQLGDAVLQWMVLTLAGWRLVLFLHHVDAAADLVACVLAVKKLLGSHGVEPLS